MSSFSGWKQTSAPSRAQIAIASRSSPSGTRGKRTGWVSNVETLKAAAPAACIGSISSRPPLGAIVAYSATSTSASASTCADLRSKRASVLTGSGSS